MGRPPIRFHKATALLVPILGLATAYFVAGKLGLTLALVNTSTTAVWPPTGIALAALLLLGRRMWPGVAIGAFLVNLSTTGDAISSVGIAAGNTLEALVGSHLVRAFANGPRAFERPQDVLKFAVLAALLSPVVSATVGTTFLAAAGLARLDDYGPIWFTWWLGDAAGALIVAPALLTWANGAALQSITSRPVEKVLLLGTVLLTGLLLFGGVHAVSIDRVPLAFMSFPALIWAAYRFGPRESAAAVLVFAGVADVGTLGGFGPFARDDPNESLLLLQAFLGVAAATNATLAAAVLDRQRAQEIIRATEQRLRMLAEESARLREDFLSIATHELRTPLTSLRGYIQLAQQGLDHGPHERTRGLLDTALRQSDRLASLIAQLLDASQAQAGGLTLVPVPTDVSALVYAAVDAAQLRSAKYKWVIDVVPGITASVDPVRFEEVLLNLVDNAVKFSPVVGTIAVRFSASEAELRLEVADQGIGIAPDRLGQIFERFYRAHDDRGRGGLGLGLYITNEIVKRHGGQIAVASEPGRGTTFTVTMPRRIEAAAPSIAEPASPESSRTGRVLVVDDDSDIRSLVAEVLRDAGLSVVTAADGREGLAEEARIHPDVIILDKLMPGMNGTEFVSAYRATGRSAAIIAFCAARDAPEWAASIGASSHIGKPFDVKELERLVLAQLPATA